MVSLQAIIFWPFLIYAAVVLLITCVMISLSWVLGERHKEKLTNEPYESGIPPTGNARLRFSSHFYVIFDLDAVFILAWAISFREVGIAGYIGILIFIGILLVVLVYEIGIKALDFGPQGKKILKFKNRLSK